MTRGTFTTDEISRRLREIDEAEHYGHAPRVAMLRASLNAELDTHGLAERSERGVLLLRVIKGGQ